MKKGRWMMSEMKIRSGNELVVEGAIAAGCKFFGGYPITPSSEIAEGMARELPKVDGLFIQMEDELAAMGAVIGASLGGKKVLTATSGPGFSLKQENLGVAMIAEVPVVIVNVMRGGPSTGLPTRGAQGDVMQARWGTHGDHPVIALAPAFPEEVFTTTIEAFNMAEKYMTPVILLLDEIVGHSHEPVVLPKEGEYEIINRKYPDKVEDLAIYKREMGEPPLRPDFFMGYPIHVESLEHSDQGYPNTVPENVEIQQKRRLIKIEKHKNEIIKYKTHYTDDAELIIFAFGSMARSALEAIKLLREEGVKIGLFQPITIWPFPEEQLKEVVKGRDTLVVELNWGQLVYEVERVLKNNKVHSLLKMTGMAITPNEIIDKIKEIKNA
jgi:2-oxoglutarate ferredoxin oxidoreductase subunit alpha